MQAGSTPLRECWAEGVDSRVKFWVMICSAQVRGHLGGRARANMERHRGSFRRCPRAWPEGEGGGWVVRDGGEGLGQECHHLFGCLCNRLHPTNLHPKLPAKCPAKLLGLAREFAREISGACPRNCPRNFWGLPAKLTAKFLGPAREIDREIDREIENEIENEMPRELPANSKHTRKCNICTGGAPEQNFENVFCVQHYGISFGQHSHNQGCMENGHAVAQVASLVICWTDRIL